MAKTKIEQDAVGTVGEEFAATIEAAHFFDRMLRQDPTSEADIARLLDMRAKARGILVRNADRLALALKAALA